MINKALQIGKLFEKYKFDHSKFYLNVDGISTHHCKYPIEPEEYLSYAKLDFESKKPHARINAITNAKRAIDCQVDSIIDYLGLTANNQKLQQIVCDTLSHPLRDVKPFKLQLIAYLNIAPITLISRIRRIRNQVEHQYKMPKNKEVFESIEMAELFVSATQNSMKDHPDTIYFSNNPNVVEYTDDQFCLDFSSTKKEIKFRSHFKPMQEIIFKSSEVEYLLMLKFLLNAERRVFPKADLVNLLHAFGLRTGSKKIKVDWQEY